MSKSRLALRERELRAIGQFFESIAADRGPTVVFEGGAGMGKTAHVRALRAEAIRRGVRVLHARGGEFERGFSWGVARQLFERCVNGGSGEDRDALFDGAAALSVPVLEYLATGDPAACEVHPTVHGLYWLCRNLARRQPLVIAVDDAHWADDESLKMLAYLANRLEDGRIGLALSTIPLEDVDQGELLATATMSTVAELVRLEPLGPEALTDMVSAEFGGTPDAAFVHALRGASMGNPQFATELVLDAVNAGLTPVGSEVSRLAELAPRRAAVKVMRSLNRLGPSARRVASAVAVLGQDADPRHCARVAGLDIAASTRIARSLVDAGVLRVGLPYGFANPIMQGAVYEILTPQERHSAHENAARTLSAAGKPVVVVAEHLLRTLPGADSWVADTLRTAAAAHLRNGGARRATTFFRRALAEPPRDEARAAVLYELGAAELRARDGAAVDHLFEALLLAGTDTERHGIRMDLAQALVGVNRYQDAVNVLADGLPEVRADQARRLRSSITALVWMTDTDVVAGVAEVTGPIWERSHAALYGLCSGLPAKRVARLAASALDVERQTDGHDHALPPLCLAAWAMAQSGRLADADKILSEVHDTSTRAGHLAARDTAAGMRSLVLFEAGRLHEAEAVAMSVLTEQQADAIASPGVWLSAAALVKAWHELDRVADAQLVLERYGLAGSIPDAAFCLPLRVARARLAIASGDVVEGMDELISSRVLSIDRAWHHPGIASDYLVPLSYALARVEESTAGALVLSEELARARAFGAPRPLAAALRATGRSGGGDADLVALEEAAGLLEETPYVLDRAHALADLGSALRRSGRRSDGRRCLALALELAHECGAAPLTAMARAELRLAGGRTRAASPSQAVRLTPAEERVAVKAAGGLTNKQISHSLFITVKTVEWHLSQAYRKLGIGRRSDLTHALSDADRAPEDVLIVG